MQLSLTPEVLVPLGLGALVVVVGVLVLNRGLRRRTENAEPTAASDWTGEQVGAPVAKSVSSGPVTVAEAVAVREAATAPLPMSVMKALAEEPPLLAGQLPDLPPEVQEVSTPAARHAAEPWTVRPRPYSAPVPDAAEVETAQQPAHAVVEEAVPDPASATSAEPAVSVSTSGSATAAEPHVAPEPTPAADPNGAAVPDEPSAEATPTGETVAAAPPPDRHAGSSRPVAAAVAQALAARAAITDPARFDARDRLLAVLLDDPARAVGATVDLAECQEQLATLTGAVRDGRIRLARALGRLFVAGLRPEQLARLSGLSDAEVQEYLAEGPGAFPAPTQRSG